MAVFPVVCPFSDVCFRGARDIPVFKRDELYCSARIVGKHGLADDYEHAATSSLE